MNKDLKQRGKLRTYKSELENSFGFVLSEAGQLYQGQGRLRKTYERLARRLDELGVSYSLVGGYALILDGVRCFTEDIDLLLSEEGLWLSET
jgi:hypothetical protein